MMEQLIFVGTAVAAFLMSYIFVKIWIPLAKKFGLIGRDLNKYSRPAVAEAGGIGVIFSLATSIFLYLLVRAAVGDLLYLGETYAIISAVLLAGLIGFSDDMLGWKKGIRRLYKPFITSVLALPFMTITLIYPQYNYFSSWGISTIIFAIVIVPIGIVGTSNAINMMGGYNGLETGVSIILLCALGIRAFMINEEWIMFLSFIGVAALLGFLIFNWYPAKVFPGDVLTYSIGTYIGAIVILGKMIFFGLAIFGLLYLEPILYYRAKYIDKAGSVISQGLPQKDGTLKLAYKHIYDSCHLAIKIQEKLRGYATERGVVVMIYSIQTTIAIIALFIWWFIG